MGGHRESERGDHHHSHHALPHGTWEEIRWLLAAYGRKRISQFVRLRGERQLSAPTFTYWRKLLGLRRWQHAPFAAEARQVWPF
ncbi:MAG: hypothetical protein ACKO4U_06190 [Caldilinea sp.]